MRLFVLNSPNLSVGRQGDIVDADQLRMNPDKLDEFVAAGYATEVFEGDPADTTPPVYPYPVAFDPAEFSVAEVRAFVDANPAEGDAVIAAERAGKNRSGIVNGW